MKNLDTLTPEAKEALLAQVRTSKIAARLAELEKDFADQAARETEAFNQRLEAKRRRNDEQMEMMNNNLNKFFAEMGMME